MRKQVNVSILPGFVFASAIGCAQPLTVFVHDYARVALPELERAEAEAERILRTAGAEVQWVNCGDSFEPSSECRRHPYPTELVLHLLPAGTTRRNAQSGALGFAVPPEPGSFGTYAGVLYERVERLSSVIISKSVVLGHAIAHELGHLLLGAGRHAPSGIMTAAWHRKELQKAAQGTLVFRSEDRCQINENIRRRHSGGHFSPQSSQSIALPR